MSESKHTPGPWEVEYSRELPDWPIGILSGKDRLADLIVAPGWQPETVGNARLIAAAPELLEAGEKLLANVGSIYRHDMDAGIRMMRAAIAKAKGISE